MKKKIILFIFALFISSCEDDPLLEPTTETEDKGIAEIIIGKQRNGPVGTCKLAFMGKYTRFENLAREYQRDQGL